MKFGRPALWIVLFVELQLTAARQLRMTSVEARKLIDAIIPANEKRTPSLVIEVDREHDGCLVYHVYQDTARMQAFTLRFWSIDARTAEVWDETFRMRVTDPRAAPIQRAIRKRLGVTDHEQNESISKPCYERENSR
jgi:hypothetical protein